MDRLQLLAKIQAGIEKKYGAGSIATLSGGGGADVKEAIPTGIVAVDHHLLGVGGLPIGRMSEWFGPESSGKSSLVASAGAAVQKMKGIFALIDAEHAFTETRARTFGVDPDEVLALDPPNLQEGGNMLIQFLKSLPDDGPPTLIVLDSVPALPTREELEGDPGDEYMGIRARFYSKLCTYLVKILPKKRAHMMFVNQTRMKIGVVYGNPETTPGGNAIKFYSSVRVRMRPDKRDGSFIGVHMKCVKNKVAEAQHELDTRLHVAGGWDDRWTTVNHAKDRELIPAGTKATDKGHAEALKALGWADTDPKGEDSVMEGKITGKKEKEPCALPS